MMVYMMIGLTALLFWLWEWLFEDVPRSRCLASQCAGLCQRFSEERKKKKTTIGIFEQRMALHQRSTENIGSFHKTLVEVKQGYQENDKLILFGHPCTDQK
ncbi:unnamed protein product [Candidula unifasciata]|uniref:Uncharacterized protein n=1 Tax=Candidula unifasciata TaxID=100452 RepID=A0A8S3YCH3_9EUPU|nr:unnamed protein product [Candidula unifasciata]